MIIYPAYKDRYEHSEHLKHVIRITHVMRDVSDVASIDLHSMEHGTIEKTSGIKYRA